MSWLARSIANSLHLDDDDDGAEENDVVPDRSNLDTSPTNHYQIPPPKDDRTQSPPEQLEENEFQSRGVKEDLTEFKQTLTRQFWGVASFLAPPPTTHDNQQGSSNNLDESGAPDQSDEEDPLDSGIGVSEMSRMGSNYYPLGSEENEGENGNGDYGEEEEEEEGLSAVGITDEVLAFASNIAHHPETWLDFPLDEEEDLDGMVLIGLFMLVKLWSFLFFYLRPPSTCCPVLEDLCEDVAFGEPGLNKLDADILSTPQVMEARAMWMQELHKQRKPESNWFERSTSYMNDHENVLQEDLVPTSSCRTPEIMSPRMYAAEPTTSTMTTDCETEKHPIESTEVQFIDKAVIVEKQVVTEDKNLLVGRSSKIQIPNYEDDYDDWPDEDSDLGRQNETAICVGNEDDISFSDLEDDDSVPMKPKVV
ncbi:BSD domain-containing protein [Citrus sinensis]|nr:BSD domain-containing protein [Citrus sinensis]